MERYIFYILYIPCSKYILSGIIPVQLSNVIHFVHFYSVQLLIHLHLKFNVKLNVIENWIIQRHWQLATSGSQDSVQRQTNHKNAAHHRKLKRWAKRTSPKTGVNIYLLLCVANLFFRFLVETLHTILAHSFHTSLIFKPNIIKLIFAISPLSTKN